MSEISTARRQIWNWGLRVAVTLLIVTWIFTRLDLTQFTQVALAPHWDALAGMILTAIVFLFLGGVKVWVLLRALAPVSLRATLGYFAVATSLGSFTPAALGDFSIAAFLRREGIPTHQGLSVMLVDRVIVLLVYALLFTPLTLALILHVDYVWWVSGILLAGVGGLLWLNTNRTVRQFVRTHLVVRAPVIENFAQTISNLLRLYPAHLAANITLSLIRSVVAGIVVYFALVAASTQPPLFDVICVTNSLTLVNLLPMSFGGVGVYEGSGILLFERLGLDGARVLAALVYQRVYIWLASLLILVGFWIYSLRRSR